jgi:hypothetical protein
MTVFYLVVLFSGKKELLFRFEEDNDMRLVNNILSD